MDVFHAVAEPTRRNILEMLSKKGRLSASDISDKFSISAPAISQHLKVLREAKLVQVEKRGQHRIYQIDVKAMSGLEKWAHDMAHQWNERLDKLDALLKQDKNKHKKYGK